jgi:hypothetical protein
MGPHLQSQVLESLKRLFSWRLRLKWSVVLLQDSRGPLIPLQESPSG